MIFFIAGFLFCVSARFISLSLSCGSSVSNCNVISGKLCWRLPRSQVVSRRFHLRCLSYQMIIDVSNRRRSVVCFGFYWPRSPNGTTSFFPFHQLAAMMYSLAQMSPKINVLLLTLIDTSQGILPLFWRENTAKFYIKPERILTGCQISFISCENSASTLICHSALLCTGQFCCAGSEKQPQDFCRSFHDLVPPLRFPTPAPKTNSLFVPYSLSCSVHMIKLNRGAFKTRLFFLKTSNIYLPQSHFSLPSRPSVRILFCDSKPPDIFFTSEIDIKSDTQSCGFFFFFYCS